MSGGVGEFSRVEHVDRVETFLSVSSPHSPIIYSRSSTEGSDTFCSLLAGSTCSECQYYTIHGRSKAKYAQHDTRDGKNR